MTAKRIFNSGIRSVLLSVTVAAGLSISTAFADTLNIKGDAPQSYTVVKGDTLWDISGKYLEKPWRWPELWEGNPQIANPHLIYPGDIISLHYVDGQPRLGINRAAGGVVKLSPTIRATAIDNAIPVIPIDAIQQFLQKITILDTATVESAPYVVRGEESRIMAAKGDRIYIKGLENTSTDSFQIFHAGETVNDPVTKEVIGHETIFVGNATLDTKGDPSTLLITSSTREVAIGDLVLERQPDAVLSNIRPKVPAKGLSGQILNVLDGVKKAGLHQAVIINLGTSDGLERGHVLSSYNYGENVPDPITDDPKDSVQLPQERSGTVLVIEPFEKLSYALVMESRKQLRVLDEVRTPE